MRIASPVRLLPPRDFFFADAKQKEKLYLPIDMTNA